MIHDQKITEELKKFVQADESERNYEEGALLLLKISANKIEYQNIMRNLEAKKRYISDRLSRYLQFRLAALTKEEVREMSEQAEKIAVDIPKAEDVIKHGRRQDHDSLPDEIQALYIETRDILNTQKELHLEIRKLALRESNCPESELYPFVKEMIDLDKKRLAKWKAYDDYKPAKAPKQTPSK